MYRYLLCFILLMVPVTATAQTPAKATPAPVALDQLYSKLGMADETSDDAMHSVCDPELPDAGEGLAWSC